MSIIKNKILYSPNEEPSLPLPELESNLGEEIIKGFNNVIKTYGDFDWLINAPFELTNQTLSIGKKRRKASELETNAR